MSKKSKKHEAAVIPTKALTPASLMRDAKQLNASMLTVRYPTADMLAEVRELLLARGDVSDLVARGFFIDDAMFERVSVLSTMLAPESETQADADDERSDRTENAERAREELLEIRERLALLGDAAGLKASMFSVDTRRHDLLVGSMQQVVRRARRAKLADQATVRVLLAQATKVINAEMAARLEGSELAKVREESTDTVYRLKRLLYDQMRHISKQGLAAYPGDIRRALWYRLDRFIAQRKPSAPEIAPDAPELNDDAVV